MSEDSKPALKMKIKRKNVSATKTTSAEVKHEIIKDSDGQADPAMTSSSDTALDRLKQALEKDRSSKVTKNSPSIKHKDRKKDLTSSSTSSPDGLTLHIKREPVGDPYEFNSKVEDGPVTVTKKIKTEKDTADSTCSPAPMHTLSTSWARRDVGVETSSIGVVTDPDCLGPCEPGSHVVLEGIVWNETPTGLLVVNVTWRGKTYVGTLMDATRHDWAPPRFNDESTPTEQDTKTPKGRGKRGRGATPAPVGESCTVGERRLRKTRGRMGANNPAAHPASPGKPDLKRKAREDDMAQEVPKVKRGKILDAPGPDGMIVCPENLCCKRYRHVNGLRYHLTHFHKRNLIYDEEGNMITEAPEEFVKPAPVTDEAKFRKRNGLDTTRADSPRKTPEVMDTLPPPSPKKADEERKRKDHGKKLEKKTAASAVPTGSAVPSPTTNSQTVPNEPEGKKTKAKKAKPVTALASVTTHPQVSVSNGDQLQPIQPKPTVLGTTPATSDLVDSLKQMKETKRAKKKKKDKKKDHHKTVIKATTVSIPTLNDGAKQQPPELHRQNMQPPQLDKQRLTPPDLQKANGQAAEATNTRTNRPPSSLSLNSASVPSRQDEADHHDSDDVRSPAYSDISDANDSVPVLENQSEDNKIAEKEAVIPQETPERLQEKSVELAKGSQPYGLFSGSYYGQPPYLTPAVAPDAPKASTPGEEKNRKTPSDKPATTPKEADKARGHYSPGYFMAGGGFPEKFRDQYMPPEFKAQKEAWLLRQKEAEPVDMSAKPIKKEQATDLSLKDKQKENKQILQENLDLKSQMPLSSPVEDPKTLLERQKDELQSYYVYQQQRMLEQQTRFLGKPKNHSPGLPHSSSKPSPKDSPKPPSTPTSSKPRGSWHSDEDPKDRVKSQERARPTPSPKGADDKRHGIPSSSSSVPHPYAHYYPHYASAGQLPFDPAAHPSPIFPAGMVPYGPNSPYMHPSQLHYLPDEEKERTAAKAEGGKALDLLQQRASQLYGNISRNHSPSAPHKIHELKDAAKERTDSPVASSKSPAPEKERVREAAPTSSSKDDKSRSSSPPTQRHLHTHHHTHVVGPAYPIYGHYPSVMASPPGASPPSHTFIQKP